MDLNIDPDIQAKMIVKLGTDGLRLWPYEALALSRFARRAKNNAYWTKLIEVIPFCGQTKEAALYKAKYHSSGSYKMVKARDTLTEVYSPRSGFVSNGSNAAGGSGTVYDTQWNPGTHLSSISSCMVAVGVVRGGTHTSIISAGMNSGGNVYIGFQMDGTTWYAPNPMTSGGGTDIAISSPSGFFVANRTATTATAYYRNGTQITTAATTNSGGANPTSNLYVYGRNDGSVGPIEKDSRVTFVAIGEGFTATDAANLYTDYVVLMNDLRRPTA